MITAGAILKGIGVLLWATPLWYPIVMEVLFISGIGYRRCGKLRRIRMTEWLSASGTGMLFGTLIFGLGRVLP